MTDVLIRNIGICLICVILILTLRAKSGEIAAVLSMVCCCMLLLSSAQLLSRIWAFLRQLEDLSNLDPQLTGILLKVVGIGFISEMAGGICSDSGNAGIAKALQIVTSITILYLSLPLFQTLLHLMERIMDHI